MIEIGTGGENVFGQQKLATFDWWWWGATIGGGQQMRHPRWHFPGPARQFLLRISAVARIVRQFLRMHASGGYVWRTLVHTIVIFFTWTQLWVSKLHTHSNLRVALSSVVEICRALKRIVEFRRILLRTVNEALCGASCSKKPAGTRMVDHWLGAPTSCCTQDSKFKSSTG